MKFLREVPQVQFVGCDVPVITQRRFFDSEGATNSVRRLSLWTFSWSAEGSTHSTTVELSARGFGGGGGFFRRFTPFFALLQVV